MSFWKRFYYGLPQPLFEAADSGAAADGGSGEGSGQPTPGDNGAAAKNEPTGTEFIPERQNVLEFLKNAPIIGGEGQQPQAGEPGNEPQQPEGTAPEGQDDGSKDGKAEPTPEKVKIGEEEFTLDQIQEFRRAYEEREKWQRNLTQRSQLDRWFQNLPPEKQDAFLARAIADVDSQKEPDAIEAPKDPVKLMLEDDDGFEYEIEVKPDTEEFKRLEEYFEKRFMAKYKDAFTELKQHQEKLQQFQQEVEQYQRRVGQQKALDFLGKHPELGLQLPNKDVDLEQFIGEIVASGPTHPQYEAAMRVINLAQIAMQNGWDLEKAYEYMYGDFIKKQNQAKAIETQARQNQKGARREAPGQGAPAMTDDEKFMSRLVGSNPLSDIFAEADKNLRKF